LRGLGILGLPINRGLCILLGWLSIIRGRLGILLLIYILGLSINRRLCILLRGLPSRSRLGVLRLSIYRGLCVLLRGLCILLRGLCVLLRGLPSR
jgi:hypothetical protein